MPIATLHLGETCVDPGPMIRPQSEDEGSERSLQRYRRHVRHCHRQAIAGALQLCGLLRCCSAPELHGLAVARGPRERRSRALCRAVCSGLAPPQTYAALQHARSGRVLRSLFGTSSAVNAQARAKRWKKARTGGWGKSWNGSGGIGQGAGRRQSAKDMPAGET